MSVSQRVQILTDRSEEFLSLVKEFVSNPKLGEQLRAEIAKLNSLTKEEEQKFLDAHELLRNHAKISSELKKREDALSADKGDHDKELSKRKEELDSKEKNLRALSDLLSQKSSAHEEDKKIHAEEHKKFLDNKNKVDRQHAEERAKLNADREHVLKVDAANHETNSRLVNFEKDLKAKAAKLRELTAEM